MNNTKRKSESALRLMFVIIVAKLVGMFRDVILANYFGTTNISDAYLVATSVPTLLFYFIGHSLSTAYIPMYNKVKDQKGQEAAQRYSNNLLCISLLLSTLIVILLLVFPQFVVKTFAMGFDHKTVNIAVRIIRISVPSIYLMTIINIFSAYLQVNKSFLVPAAISLPRNFAVIVSIIIAYTWGIDWLGIGLLSSYLLELCFLLPFVCKKGYKFHLVLDIKDEQIKNTLYLIAPILLGMCVGQVNKIVDRSMASSVVAGGVSVLSYAAIINNAIQEILVTGIITILFASCAELVTNGRHEEVKIKLRDTIESMSFLILPATFGVFVLAEPIVELFLLRGEFDHISLSMTVGALRCYTVGILFLAIRDTLVKVFYAYKETKITTATSVIAIFINIILNIVLGSWIGLNGLALATSLSAMVNCILLFVLLRKRIGDFGTATIIVVLIKSLIGGAIMAGVVFASHLLLEEYFNSLVALLISVGIGCIVYFIVEIAFVNKPIMNVLRKIVKR